MKDPFSIFIQKSVDYTTMVYYDYMFETKQIFFNFLKEKKDVKSFEEEISKLWDNIDRSFIDERIKELEKMLDEKNLKGENKIHPNAKFKEVYELVSYDKFAEVEKIYKETIIKYYKGRLKTISKDYLNEEAYLSEIVNKYEEVQAIIPYFNKNGTIRCYHNVASYNSMLTNVNMNRAGWNRTMYDANLLGMDLLYLPAHPFACPLCMPYQGKVYSKSGKNKKYPSKEVAENGGIGHPNCKHQWLIYWGEEMLQDEKYNSSEWEEKYKTDQKLKSLDLELSKLENDMQIYKAIGNYEQVDKTLQKIEKINSIINELL